MIVMITEEEDKLAWEFARKKSETTAHYQNRGQSPNPYQEHTGMAGEIALCRHLGVEPDMKIYSLENKHFYPDAGRYDCKTCAKTTTKKYNGGLPSWSFQFGDRDGSNKSVDPVKRASYLLVEVGHLAYDVRWFLEPATIKRIWTEPDKDSLKPYKRVVREQDIPPECQVVEK